MFVICAEDALNSLGARTSTFLVIVTGWPVLLPLDHRPAPSRFTPWQLSPPVLLIAVAQLRPPEMEFQRRTDPPPDLVFQFRRNLIFTTTAITRSIMGGF
jgi:hypothetical protein